jgi:basic amino acid/polyamine antiporter, APA family
MRTLSRGLAGRQPLVQGAGKQATTRSPVIGTAEAVALIVGLVIGAGIFTLPAAVAAHVGNAETLYLTWVAGALLALTGAACYAELATTWPDSGGEYAFLRRAFGAQCAFLFAWARASVIVTGSLAFLAFTYGDHMSVLVPLGPASTAVHGAVAIILLTALNLRGLRTGMHVQSLLTALEVSALIIVIVVGLVLLAPAVAPSAATAPLPAQGVPSLATALLFVMFAYGGWNEAAYLSAETRSQATLVRATCWSTSLVCRRSASPVSRRRAPSCRTCSRVPSVRLARSS